jgi:tetratricopeptide (TPR) repeat protein
LAQAVVALAVLGTVGCAQVNAVKSKVSESFGASSSTQTSSTRTDDGTQSSGQVFSLATITNTYLLHGRYAEGEQQLRRYLAKYPGDRAAQGMLHQLTSDPKAMLGAQSRPYVVQPGDSYSTLAARNLGDPNQFLILARYNGSANPSTLRAGDTVRLPLAGAPLTADAPASRGAADSRVATVNAETDHADATTPATTPTGESTTARAQRLQAESVALQKQGQQDQALARLDEALTLDPHLKPAGNQALRQQLLASYHERAVVLYRDQKLDQAIALWDRVLAIDPSYERAVIYRARAVDLQHRLNQM